nr:tgt_general: tRNA-guanine family transglycosylase [uncultured bacterium]
MHGFTGYKGAILTDSGGFQLYSLIRENAEYGEIRDKEIIFRPDRGKEKITFTPEKCIQVQFQYGSDIMMALDMCTHPGDPIDVQRRSVELTVRWGARCRAEYDKLVRGRKGPRPLLFGIVQGGRDRDLRLECGRRLEEIGFDGYGFGGWPLDGQGALREDILQMAADAMPDHKIKYAMGLGKPEEIVECVKMGYSLIRLRNSHARGTASAAVCVCGRHGNAGGRAFGCEILSLPLRDGRKECPRPASGG